MKARLFAGLFLFIFQLFQSVKANSVIACDVNGCEKALVVPAHSVFFKENYVLFTITYFFDQDYLIDLSFTAVNVFVQGRAQVEDYKIQRSQEIQNYISDLRLEELKYTKLENSPPIEIKGNTEKFSLKLDNGDVLDFGLIDQFKSY